MAQAPTAQSLGSGAAVANASDADASDPFYKTKSEEVTYEEQAAEQLAFERQSSYMAFQMKSVRRGFVRKVFSIVVLQLVSSRVNLGRMLGRWLGAGRRTRCWISAW
jgi:hypothetical protein